MLAKLLLELERICEPIAHHGKDYNAWRQTERGKKAYSYVEASQKLQAYFKKLSQEGRPFPLE